MFRPTLISAVLRAGLVVCALTALAACGKDKPLPPCPQVRIDSTTGQITKFREGGSAGLNDVEYQARILGYKGECDFQDDGVEVVMDVAFEVASGPAAQSGRTPIYYFIALPQFFPDAEGKKIMVINHDLEPGVGRRERVNENGVRVFIPLAKDEPAAAFDVYIGLQLTPEQLEYNRELQRARE